MDGVLVDNMRIHARAYDIFYERHGVGNRQNVLKELSGLGNDEIMQRLFTPERLAGLGGWAGAQRGEGGDLPRTLRTAHPADRRIARFSRSAPPGGNRLCRRLVGRDAQHPFRLREVRHRVLLSDRGQQRAGHALQTRSGDIPQSGRSVATPPRGVRRIRRCPCGYRGGRSCRHEGRGSRHDLSREELERTAATLVIDDFTQMSVERLRSL